MDSKTGLGYIGRLSQKRNRELIVSFYGLVFNFDFLLGSEISSCTTVVALLPERGTAILRQD